MFEFKVFLNKQLLQRTVLSKPHITVGRSLQNDIVLQDKHVSRLHFVLRKSGESFLIENKSLNGLLLNGKKIEGLVDLPKKCEITVLPFIIHATEHGEDNTLPISIEKLSTISDPETLKISSTTAPMTITTHFGTLVGESPAMQQLYQRITDVAPSRATVLIRGEHGTGKELVAKAIHQLSPRHDSPMIIVNCAALPIDLIESELFGYEKGAFTGAMVSHKGKVEEAEGGTLFLDEIGELSSVAQAKILRFLQDHSYMHLGSGKEMKADVRIVAATNKNLEKAMQNGSFRADLYYRLKVLEMMIPPLREHPEDIHMLCTHFLEKFAEELNLAPPPQPSPELLQYFQTEQWQGNIRQLENCLYGALVYAHPPYLLTKDDFPDEAPTFSHDDDDPSFDKISKQLLLQTLENQGWDTTKAADKLKVSRGTIYYRLKKYGVDLRKMIQ
ncbi:MAG: FHA domain-containing protein [Nitrospirae bacterium]|nr:FHA domain-containing protein [Candidatus Manganitrophaceae bacterium]